MSKHDKIKKLKKLVAAFDETPTCELCLNDAWWPANGFSQQEREAICAFLGCPIVPQTAA
jgi:hypothetical protein